MSISPAAGLLPQLAVIQHLTGILQTISLGGASDMPSRGQRNLHNYSISPSRGDMVKTPGGRVLRIRRCLQAQDGHSRGEHAVYLSLWNAGEPEQGDSRIISMGLGALARIIRLDISNVRNNLRTLMEKHAIELVAREQSEQQQGKTYRVFSSRRILENREKVGQEWVVRSKGVVFISTPAINEIR